MKNATQCSKKLAALLKKLPEAPPPQFPDQDDPIAVLIQSFLLADASTDKAIAAYGRIREHVVDHNDLRVCMPQETLGYIGGRYPRGLERCRRIRAALRNVYLREHAVSLDPLKGQGKRDAKKYVESLEGMFPYVSARVLLLCFDTHAIPVDEQHRAALLAAGAVDDDADESEIASWLARQVKAATAPAVHFALQAWVEKKGARSRKRESTAKKKTERKAPSTKRSSGTSARKPMGSRAGSSAG